MGIASDVGNTWQIADGWATEAEANAHADALKEAHSEFEFRVHKSSRAFGGGNWLVLYKRPDGDAGGHGTGFPTPGMGGE